MKAPKRDEVARTPPIKGKSKPLMLGDIEVTEGHDTPTRIAMLLWGDINVGKTVYAATAPGPKKLWLNLDPEGRNSILNRNDIMTIDLDGLGIDELFRKMQNDNPLGLDDFLGQHEEIGTVVLDSGTALAWRALQKSVRDGVGSGRGFTPTIEEPGRSAYGGRNNIVITCITGLLKVTAKHNRHCIIITHEDDPTRDEKTNATIAIGMMLGGKMVRNFGWRLSEIWHMSKAGDNFPRKLRVRSTKIMRPMKTRLFSVNSPAEFTLGYDADKPDKGQPDTIAAFYNRWVDGDFEKLMIKASKGDRETDD